MDAPNVLRSLITALLALLHKTPSDNRWIVLIFTLLRIILFSLLLRTYILPWLFRKFSSHIRLRSISLRSIRGLYISRGNGTWRIERLSYSWSRVDGQSRHLTIKVEGLVGEISKIELKSTPPSTGHKRSMTVVAVSFAQRHFWHTLSGFFNLVDPLFRPIIRTAVVWLLRRIVYWIPSITSAVFFDIHPAKLKFTGNPEFELAIDRVHLHTSLDFRQVEKPNDSQEKRARRAAHRLKRSYSVAAWRSRFTSSFERTWDRAIETREGVASLVFELHNIVGSLPSDASFFRLPGAISVHTSMNFDPRRRTLKTHTSRTDVKFGGCFVDLDVLLPLFQAFKAQPAKPPPPPDTPLFSPKLSFLRLSSPLLSRTPRTLDSGSAVLSPSSPFLDSLTASLLPRRHHYRPCMKLNDTQSKATLSFLDSVQIHIASVSLTTSPKDGSDTYRTVIENVKMNVGLSDPQKNIHHRDWLGRGDHTLAFDSDVYGVDVTIDELRLTRSSVRDQLRLASVGQLRLNALVTQWPSPLLVTSPFLGGDPNAPSVLLRLGVDSVNLTERLDSLLAIVRRLPERKENRRAPYPTSAPSLVPVPRIKLDLHCGPICSRLIIGSIERPHTAEMRTDGFILSFGSYFDNRYSIAENENLHTFAEFDRLSLRMIAKLTFVWKPTFIRIRSQKYRRASYVVPDFSEDPPLLSLEAIEAFGDGEVLAAIRDDTQNTACIDLSTVVSNVSCSTEVVCLELWHPDVLDCLVVLLNTLPPVVKKERSPYMSLRDRLPLGCTATFSLARLVAFVTAPEIRPSENLELSRGFALRVTGMSAQYCSLNLTHLPRYNDHLARTKSRQRLFLSKERSVAAWEEVNLGTSPSAFMSFYFDRAALRSAIATQYSADDPLMAERDDPTLQYRDFLQIHGVSAEARVYSSDSQPGVEICDSSVRIPYIQANFHLADMYSVMLAAQTCRTLARARPRVSATETTEKAFATPPLSVQFNAAVSTVQIHAQLRDSRVFGRLDSISAQMTTDAPLVFRWEKLVLWALIPTSVNRWQRGKGKKWEEILSLQSWNIYLQQPAASKAVSIEGETARFRIPFGFVLADLILDASVVFKALRHIYSVTSTGQFSPIPIPEAEGPKMVPDLTLKVAYLFFEAADDPFETKLGRIFKSGPDAAKNRMDREDAFIVKVNNILAAEGVQVPERDADWEFSSNHSVSVQDARDRLDQVHVLDWVMRLEQLKDEQIDAQANVFQHLRRPPITRSMDIPTLIPISPVSDDPPLIRTAITNLSLTISGPSFPSDCLSDFLFEQGQLPKHTQYTLLVPLHLNFSVSALQVTLRDYPLAMVNIPPHSDITLAALEFETDLVIAEEMGTERSIEWVDCPIILSDSNLPDIEPLSLSVPKTIMPVKTYANPEIRITTPEVTSFCWGVSYGPATQDIMRIVDTLSSSPRDPSPPVGFWDKLRLVLHWSIRISFRGEVRFHMKGLRDPYEILGAGAGFLYSWNGNTKFLIGRKNKDNELVQVISDSMLIAIPRLRKLPEQSPVAFNKICAKFLSGIKFGLGFVFERSCGSDCDTCVGSPFHRKCRYFEFLSHHLVKLEKKDSKPDLNGSGDSYAGFRSNFIHLAISLTASTRTTKPGTEPQSSSLHLTPRSFASFWSWWHLFDGVMSLPIRHGSYFPRRVITPKLGRHIATLKYRLMVPRLFVMHGYMDDSRDTWVDGVSPWVGVKAHLENFQVDMHQRDQEMTVPGPSPSSTKVIRRKPFYAAEVAMQNLDLRAIVAIFKDSLKRAVGLSAPGQKSSYRARDDLPSIDLSSSWYDVDDLVETDWSTNIEPTLHVLPVASCPRLTYFKKNTAALDSHTEHSKFGNEDTHQCLLGGEPSVPQIQSALASERIDELTEVEESSTGTIKATAQKMTALLQRYITHLQESDLGQPDDPNVFNYSMPADSVSPDEWAEFDHVFQIHCPKIFMDSAIRDIMMQYYYCSRARRGFEYHMATRAVKFIRDQAEAALATQAQDTSNGETKAHNPAHAAASAIRKILVGDAFKSGAEAESRRDTTGKSEQDLNPMSGWSEGVSVRKAYCCLLLKPQFVLRNRGVADETCVVAAVQAKLQSFAIMDDANLDDPISGKVMTRTYAVLSGMQTFAPTFKSDSGDGCVPLEVLIDLRCESDAFERLVPQTDASFQYDKFNRLRLRNNVTSVIARKSNDSSDSVGVANHLHDQTDLIQVQIPRFTVSASDHHFETISNIITRLLLYTDAAHKTRLDHLETLLFQYDFTDLASSAQVISDLQRQMRKALDVEYLAAQHARPGEEEPLLELMRLRAHMFLLAERLNYLFEAIKLAQDRFDDQTDRKSATLLHASSSEISWRMIDEQRDLLAKLAVQDIDYYWLKRQDSSTVNHLTVKNLQAFDGSRDATWAEILSKHDEPAYHPLLKRGIFVLSNWAVLPPVGGITIYESFELSLHPLRLQIDAKVGRRIMEYVYPSRKSRRRSIENSRPGTPASPIVRSNSFGGLDSPTRVGSFFVQEPLESDTLGLTPPLRKLGASRSFTDLRTSAAQEVSQISFRPPIQRTRSSENLRRSQNTADGFGGESREPKRQKTLNITKPGDAAEMKTRSSQKTFVLVKISSLHLLLSIMKEDAFVCRDARIRTRDLEFRNQTLSFEELVNQFIPSDMSWKGWVKMAFHQPLVPVLPVARELISKTKWIASKSTNAVMDHHGSPPKSSRTKSIANSAHVEDEGEGRNSFSSVDSRPPSSLKNSPPKHHPWKKASHRTPEALPAYGSGPFTADPEPVDEQGRPNRKRGMTFFSRASSSKSGKSDKSIKSSSSSSRNRLSNELTRSG